MESIKQFFKSFMTWVGRMSASQVMMLLGIAAGTVVGLIFVVGWLSTVNYTRLYSNLSEAEAGEVVAYLQDSKIAYELTDGGRTVLVPSDQVYQARISLASEGLPRGGNMGYSIFDQNNLGMTDFLQNLNFRRALEGELTRTITQLNEVKAARVHIVIPKDRLFREDQKQATASVVLKLSGKGSLSKSQINGITHLVASSVEGLSPDNITILDYDGNLLSSGQESDPLAGLSSSQLEVRKNVEAYLEDKANSMLASVLGPGTSVVRVTADLNFQQIEKTSETFDPNAPSIRSEERVKTSNSSSDKPVEAAESTAEDASETVITNYELNKTMEHIINAVGSVDRLSVAVMVDGTYSQVENENGAIELIYQPRSQEELDRLAAIVKNAVGFDQQRNDQIEMVNIAFDRQNLEEDRQALDSMYLREFYWNIARKIGYVLVVVLLLIYFRKKSKKLFAAVSQLVPSGRPQRPRAEMATAIEDEPVEAIVAEKRQPTLVDKMQQTAKGQPEEIAKVIKTMMVE
ncbi:MAG: flagellar basal-body MS-ring/collar protein FliF [candidate division Zixibacteria bacterium]|nr:flagellar basal-body MS-ring/collar protein FliF [candidate division Zixibacteria bacterium]